MRMASSSSSGQVVGQARDAGMHLGASQLFVVGLFAGGHFHQRRTAEKHLGPVLDEYGVVAHGRRVGPAGGAVAEDERDRGNACGRHVRQMAKAGAAGEKDLGLPRQVGSARLGERDVGQAVALADVVRAHRFAHRIRIDRAAANRGIVAADVTFDARDDADARVGRRADFVVGARGGDGRQLEKRRVAVHQQLDPLAHRAACRAGDGVRLDFSPPPARAAANSLPSWSNWPKTASRFCW